MEHEASRFVFEDESSSKWKLKKEIPEIFHGPPPNRTGSPQRMHRMMIIPRNADTPSATGLVTAVVRIIPVLFVCS
jgi:hypothetical protein